MGKTVNFIPNVNKETWRRINSNLVKLK